MVEAKPKRRKRRYLLEVNRGLRDNRDIWTDRLEQSGIRVDKLSHLTSVIVHRPAMMRWPTFKAALIGIMQNRKSASLLLSSDPGAWFICRNSGNQKGKFVRQK